ncbi:aromatic amino acid lyase [Rathayibacter soli]|uniref:aromatic amino acid lyase n=1 Tax=Rathayibacter soli TaxID=3144168 RepID=UPI0027E51575|nr:aromatic amino acid lyase [Glaciibacter superstes]
MSSSALTIVTALTNTAQENPLFTNDAAIHHAGFHQVALALKADALVIALAALTPVSLSRIRVMSEPDYTGMRPFHPCRRCRPGRTPS